MSSSFFFLDVERTDLNSSFIDQMESWAVANSQQIYVVDTPLGEARYSYDYPNRIVVLSPGYKLAFIDFGGGNDDEFSEFVDDFIEDVGSISDKFRYKPIVGRPRHWRDTLTVSIKSQEVGPVSEFFQGIKIEDVEQKRNCELIISLLTGSINDVEKVGNGVPDNLLDKVKRKIILFDGDQTRFIYEKPSKKRISIQGLSGTGKTELLLHKLKEMYVENPNNKIAFTCHSKILAENMRNRIPAFFNFMKVEEQIAWDERLWCVNAWGSGYNMNSGIYAYICAFYEIPFLPFGRSRSFDYVCKAAAQELKQRGNFEEGYAFDYLFIDESQDFSSSFFELCEIVTKKNVYVAGDVFQSIFDEDVVADDNPDYSLSKCYRTDPRTLMFAHALGMGLFEQHKLRWLTDDEWEACGYLINKHDVPDSQLKNYALSREPLRRFEDVEHEGYQSVEMVKTNKERDTAETKIIEIIGSIIEDNPTVEPDDIGVIFIDNTQASYDSADRLEVSVPEHFGWDVNKAYESKKKVKGQLFVSNKNNVKGLEFPFVICVSKRITYSLSYRNSLYMMLTRSFLRTYFLISEDANMDIVGNLESGLDNINRNGCINVVEPTIEERNRIKSTLRIVAQKKSHEDFMSEIFDSIGVKKRLRKKLYSIVVDIVGMSFDEDDVMEVAQFNYKRMIKG